MRPRAAGLLQRRLPPEAGRQGPACPCGRREIPGGPGPVRKNHPLPPPAQRRVRSPLREPLQAAGTGGRHRHPGPGGRRPDLGGGKAGQKLPAKKAPPSRRLRQQPVHPVSGGGTGQKTLRRDGVLRPGNPGRISRRLRPGLAGTGPGILPEGLTESGNHLPLGMRPRGSTENPKRFLRSFRRRL